jgi:tRNA-dihydrouridine synthase
MADGWDALRRGVALAELGGYGDGPYCAQHGRGAALVLLGTYVIDRGDDVPYAPSFVFKPDPEAYSPYLRQHVAVARQGGAAVGVSAVSVDADQMIDFLRAAEEAGADYVSACLHSTMPMFTEVGMSSALLRREHWPRLRQQMARCLDRLTRPFIVKVGFPTLPDAEEAVGEMASVGVRAVHANVGDVRSAEGRRLIRRLSRHGVFLIVSGGIRSPAEAEAALEAGAGAVAVGTAAMADATLCGRLQEALRGAG